MTKKNIFKLLATVVVLFFTVNMANSQPNNTGSTQWGDGAQAAVGDYVRSNVTPINSPVAADYLDKITVGKTMPFWVWPSAVYNPDFNFGSILSNYSTRLQIENNVVSDFAWKMGVFDTDDATTETNFDGAAVVPGAFGRNYVEIAFPVVGERLIQVIESPAAAPCPAEAVWFGVTVIAEPMVKFANAGITQAGVPNTIAIGCVGSTAVAAAATAIGIDLDNTDEVVIGDTPNSRYHINLSYTVYNVDIDGASGDLDWSTPASVTTVGLPTINVFGADGATAVSTANPLLATATTLIAGNVYGLEGAKATVYEFTLNSWNAGISRKSDYIAKRLAETGYTDYGSFAYYTHNSDAGAVLVNRIVVLPNPVTGPIYHIPNGFAF